MRTALTFGAGFAEFQVRLFPQVGLRNREELLSGHVGFALRFRLVQLLAEVEVEIIIALGRVEAHPQRPRRAGTSGRGHGSSRESDLLTRSGLGRRSQRINLRAGGVSGSGSGSPRDEIDVRGSVLGQESASAGGVGAVFVHAWVVRGVDGRGGAV